MFPEPRECGSRPPQRLRSYLPDPILLVQFSVIGLAPTWLTPEGHSVDDLQSPYPTSRPISTRQQRPARLGAINRCPAIAPPCKKIRLRRMLLPQQLHLPLPSLPLSVPAPQATSRAAHGILAKVEASGPCESGKSV